ncbi:hypothetical protein PHYBLDRAFT_146979 [Phycomyces blakesleeanus NRRL 1555(-)]|uniref:Uncharacterized protein n=1 Tax=Phycomyces blakesleeanus (strain ATCC 8743b / DSM 1359 / FGSC 10004 / NBRC 33097 / NRRL 1555) TaxID=763407 RepID=A0A163DKV2_PHYB8|nr:hypothetical protein PHYBLDRAFT_146979 [Phycomyces blakesleeanus NRRL 1555(-)]OAD72000.1 hypothetical protein PHYBLDRAFT_146979 [Phycomyces blakesleeanus NRRL 1555(-)]|eukprot:XP_018290040.1 hypothetical protein PHYBLDRAFT_146979 [Phycomyces blakesleeanus NRRL 1555(-)]
MFLVGVSGARFPKKSEGPLLSLKTHHSVDSPLTSMPTSLVPPVMAHRQTKPLKESTLSWLERGANNAKATGSTPVVGNNAIFQFVVPNLG